MNHFIQNLLLAMSGNRFASQFTKKIGFRFGGAKRLVAGETIQAAIHTIQKLNQQGFSVTLGYLGENVLSEKNANEYADFCVRTLDEIHLARANSNLSVKLTQLGLDVSRELCMYNMQRILLRAKQLGIFVRIDMEDYGHNQASVEIFKELVKKYGTSVGFVLQSYLHKSMTDWEELQPYKPNLSFAKGTYKVSADVAFTEPKDVEQNFIRLIEKQLLAGNYTGIATRDEKMIQYVIQFVREHQIPKSQFEFQMLYGFGLELHQKLVEEGYTVRVYVPFGQDWYGYFMRRMAKDI